MSTLQRAQRIAAIQVSEILRIVALAAQRRSEGRPVIVLGAGEPDFDTPDHIKEAAIRAIRAGQTRYTVLDGTSELKAAIQGKFRRENGLDYAPGEITAGAGAKQVMHNAFMATLDPGDEVILAAPYWTSYADMVLIAGGRPVPVLCTEDDGFRLQAHDLGRRSRRARAGWLAAGGARRRGGAGQLLRPRALLPHLVRGLGRRPARGLRAHRHRLRGAALKACADREVGRHRIFERRGRKGLAEDAEENIRGAFR